MFNNLQRFGLSLRQNVRHISSREWRIKNNAPRMRLDDMQEWSYVDGRGAGPPSIRQKNRYIRDQELAETVVRRFKELQSAKALKK